MKPISELARDMLDSSLLWTETDWPFAAALQPGHPQVLLVAGENCSGKSIFVESLRGWGRAHHDISTISVSIRERVGGGTFEMASLRRTMMFGDENEHSTGATSARVVDTAFHNVDSRAEAGHSALLVLDEPELGLSEGYARAMGQFIGHKVRSLPTSACGVAVVTHSRGLARALRDELGTMPSFVLLGAVQGFEDWLESVETRSMADLLALPETDRTRWRAVQDCTRESRNH